MAKTQFSISVEDPIMPALAGVQKAMRVSRSRAIELIVASWLVDHGWLEDPEEVMHRTLATGESLSVYWVPRPPPSGPFQGGE